MAFAGSFGAAAALIPFGIITNLLGETSPGYDANGNIMFTRASGQVYTPTRVDTLIITATTDQTPPLGICTTGLPTIADADTGGLTTAAPGANQHGLPVNFGPGRGRWGVDPTGFNRLRASVSSVLNVGVVADSAGSVQTVCVLSGANCTVEARSYFGEVVDTLVMTVECLHSTQA